MWQVTAQRVEFGLFQPFVPEEVLYDFDGPRTFTLRDRDGQLCLAHWCDEAREIARFLVVPFTEQLVGRLKEGGLTLREALNQARLWALDMTYCGEVREAWIVQCTDLPQDVLPHPETMLLRSLEREKSV